MGSVGDAAFLQFSIKSRFPDTQQPGCLEFVAVQYADRVQNGVLLQIRDRRNLDRSVPRAFLASGRGNAVNSNADLLQLCRKVGQSDGAAY